MDISTCTSQLLSDNVFLQNLPAHVLDVLQNGTNVEYLNTIASLALDPKYTYVIFVTHEVVFVEICSRWLESLRGNSGPHPLAVVAALARVLPLASHLSVYAKEILFGQQLEDLNFLSSGKATALVELQDSYLHSLLLSVCRLLRFDNQSFATLILPAQLQLLLSHRQQPIRYLAIRIFCLYLHASDAAMEKMIGNYCSQTEIVGEWEDKTIDYLFFTIWEETRLKQLAYELTKIRETCRVCDENVTTQRLVELNELSNQTACVGDVLVSCLGKKAARASSIVMTERFKHKLRRFAQGVNEQRPLLVTGLPGSGKTTLVKTVSRELGIEQPILTLHLNEQTDAKLLVGAYVTSSSPGSFAWRPGILLNAVTEGRWVLVEDLDRAPTEILSILLPLLERRELFVPHWGETIQAAPGFKIIATIRSRMDSRGDEVIPGLSMLGIRHWLRIPLHLPASEELAEIIASRFSILHAYAPRMIQLYSSLSCPGPSNPINLKASLKPLRQFGPQTLYNWCGRLEDHLLTAGLRSGNEPISEALNDLIFLEAVDCFAGHLPEGPTKTHIVTIISKELHVPPERVRYCLKARKPQYFKSDTMLRIGRTSLKRKHKQHTKSFSQGFEKAPFAATNHFLRILDSVAMAVRRAEPCLLIGETGTGKTALVQQLADTLGYQLTVVNLSQQSEVGDLLGGFKPLNLRALAMPLKEEFEKLFDSTFSSKRNQNYIDIVEKAILKGRWSRGLVLWKEALRKAETALDHNSDIRIIERQPKRRKLDPVKHETLKRKWAAFAYDLQKFKMHVGENSKAFAFSFIEGNIAKAARKGHWVLLDEINLAPQDTLESLADLISGGSDEAPSLLLSESQDTERIVAHRDFRIFGAMNPATDVGKRDLPISIRSRFTEIYLDPPDRDLEDLVLVVKTYLGDQTHQDVQVATDVARLYLEIKSLVDDNRLVDGARQKPHFSLRTLTRTLVYVTDIASIYGLRRALYEGFSMSFLTVLEKASESLLLPLMDKYLLASAKNSRSLLRQTVRAPHDIKAYVQFRHYWIAQGTAPIQKQPHYIITPFIERNLLNLTRATSSRRFPVLLQGPTSSGKTSMIEYLARISGNKFVRINNHEHTDLQEYFGSYVSGVDGRIQYQEGILVQALKEGHWIVLDELNLAPSDVLEALNRLLDDNKELLVPETQQVVKPHESFMLFATQNPPGVYGGRKVLSRAFRNRFLQLHFDDIPEDELETILRERSQIAPSFCSKIVAVYQKLSVLRQRDRLFEQKNSFATLRDLFRWALRDADSREYLAINGFLLLAERVRSEDERSAVKSVIEDVMNVNIDSDNIYRSLSSQAGLFSNSLHNHGVVWTISMRRLYVLVTEALKRNEPVLLVGETGSGKTTICQVISAMMNTRLYTVNAQQNMETSDIIGAQRPVRNQALREAQLKEDVITVLKDRGLYKEEYVADYPGLLEVYDALLQEETTLLPSEILTRIEQNRAKLQSLFEWSDGSLVQAMRNGQHFMLDEISLADDSVLERLNSVLEPERTLLLAEKGPSDNLVTASQGFQFLATMNPGGDYGKKELSPALRNRFTEIWVPHITDFGEILEIARAKVSAAFAGFTTSMVAFAKWYSTTYSSVTPVSSIRDILSWIQFVNIYQGPDPYFALLHGAAMVYIDGLGANPAAKIWIGEADVPAQRYACLRKLDELFHHDMVSIYNKNIDVSFTHDALNIGAFSIERKGGPSSSDYHLQAPTTKSNAMKVIRALYLRKPILLEGSPGVGKTTLVVALAQLTGNPLTRINLSDQTDLMDLFGSDVPAEGTEVGNFVWRDAPFLRAMQRGEWVLLDEMNLASQAVLEGLNACFDHRGQIYVSELDQTFTRHPRFKVFAAQNPHHQGGGRKGLPVSFVNRFTTVYADAFTPEDMLLVCTQLYPCHSAPSTQVLVRCITELDLLLRTDRATNGRGGPWEINLRDLLRWLHLLTSVDPVTSAGSAADFQGLVLLQRFRDFEDKKDVFKVLEKYLPQAKQSYGCFRSLASSYVQIGFGLIARDPLLQEVVDQHILPTADNLRLLESAMLCIQNKWPCLLVGPSGCGKTRLLLQLASYVGTDVVNIPMNAEIDTMDMIGGYEQRDTQREIVGLLNRLRQETRRLIVETILSDQKINPSIAILNRKLQSRTPDLPEIVNLSRRLESIHPGLTYSHLANKVEDVLQPSVDDKRTHFAWVDGFLVTALKKGQWLILDNVNLCNLSVLDRLNSLLEPDGALSINENRSFDGDALLVKPHPNFRIFLSMDPCNGELSRAMRNRCVEIYMPLVASPKLEARIGAACEPALSRFNLIENLQSSSSDEAQQIELSSIFLDHLSFADYRLTRRWQGEISKGLLGVSPLKEEFLNAGINVRHRVLEIDGHTIQNIESSYEKIATNLRLKPDFNKTQLINPLHNPVLLTLDNCFTHSNLEVAGYIFEYLIEIVKLETKIEFAAQTWKSKLISQMTTIEKSLAFNNSKRLHINQVQPLGKFLRDMGQYLRSLMNTKSIAEQIGRGAILPFAIDVLFYLRDIFDLAESSDFDEGNLQIYLSIGKSIAARGLQEHELEFLAQELNSKLNLFNEMWQLRTGLSMETLWRVFKPPVAKSMLQLQARIKVEKLADQLNAIFWRLNRPAEDLDSIRRSIVTFHESIDHSEVKINSAFKDIEDAIHELQKQSSSSQHNEMPHFSIQFEGLCQHKALVNANKHSKFDWVLNMLAGRFTDFSAQTKPDSSSWSLLSRIEACTGIRNVNNSLVVLRNSLPFSILGSLKLVSEVPLRCLSSLRKEMNIMTVNIMNLTGSLSADNLYNLNCVVVRILIQICQSHEEYLDSGSLGVCGVFLNRCLERSWKINSTTTPILHAKSEISPSHFLTRCLDNYINPALIRLHKAFTIESKGLVDAASAWILVFTCCLHLYVPDHPFDPALKLFVQRDRYIKRQKELQAKLKALQDFQMMFSGKPLSFRHQIVRNQLQALGDEPQVLTVPRPQVSELYQLQGEFNNLLTSVVNKSPSAQMLQSFHWIDITKIREIQLLISNIGQVVFRLSARFYAYEDITKPSVAMLQGLKTGLAMALIANAPESDSVLTAKSFCKSTPFLGMRADYYSRASLGTFETHQIQKSDSRQVFLRNAALYQNVHGNLSRSIRCLVLETFQSAYVDWKGRLEADQWQEAAKFSMYRYRGAEFDEVVVHEKEFLEVFPDYSETKDKADQGQHNQTLCDQQLIARQVATCQHQIFGNNESVSEQVLGILENSAAAIGELWKDDSEIIQNLTTAQDMMCGVLLRLSKYQSIFQLESHSDTYNFYKDASLAEVSKLRDLMQEVQSRFLDIVKAWPEQATIRNILQSASEIMSFRFIEPLAKILTKTEQLHGFMYEWQVIASKEYSAVNLYDRLTDLLISWRRLELSTWAQLLDMEDKKCRDDAESWWFIAYENIIAVPLTLVRSGEDVRTHTQHLFTILGDFLATTSIGQFSRRLRLVECFKRHLELFALEEPGMTEVQYTITNCLCLYTRFEKRIHEFLRDGRRVLENAVKEVLLLASWKDININALRESAKRSHHKLFKIIRKYRALLGQSAERFIKASLLDNPSLSIIPQFNLDAPTFTISSQVIATYARYIPDWVSKPARFRDPLSTARHMMLMSRLPDHALGSKLCLHHWVNDLLIEMKILQNETPSERTKDNDQLIKHLKTRKKKFFADALKMVRQMGFRSHLNADTLAKTASTSLIMANYKPLPFIEADIDTQDRDLSFHKFLLLMPQVRHHLKSHSDDINTRDIARSIGYLESILAIIVSQRSQLADILSDFKKLNDKIGLMRNLWAPETYTIHREKPDDAIAAASERHTVCWLSVMIEVACILIEQHGKLGDSENKLVSEALAGWKDRMKTLVEAYRNLPDLPYNLASSVHEQTNSQARRVLFEFQNDLKRLIRENPQIVFILRQIQFWTTDGSSSQDFQTSEEQTINFLDFDHLVSKMSDSILVAIQRVHDIFSSFPSSREGKNWLVETDIVFKECTRMLYVRDITLLLDEAMSQVTYVEIEGKDGLAAAGALCGMTMPIINQYRQSASNIIDQYAIFSQSICKLACVLAESFCHVASQGFCGPPEDSATETGQSNKQEEGIGLGDGEGMKDISKEIQEDEDLSELAQERKGEDDTTVEDQHDAVNMDQEELQGEMEDASESEKEGKSGDESDDMSIEEESGNVDDLNPSAVDEKLWDENQETEKEKEKERSETNGKTRKDEQVAPTADEKERQDLGNASEEDLMSNDDAEEEENVGNGETEKLDPYLEEGENLNLPDEIDINTEDQSSIVSESDLKSMDDMSTDSEEAQGEGKPDNTSGSEEEDLLEEKAEESKAIHSQDNNFEEQDHSEEIDQTGSPVDAETEDQGVNTNEDILRGMDTFPEQGNDSAHDAEGLGKDGDAEIKRRQNHETQAQRKDGMNDNPSNADNVQPTIENGQPGRVDKGTEALQSRDDSSEETIGTQAFKRLGDALERWHRQRRQIQNRQAEQEETDRQKNDIDMADPVFEHVNDDEDITDTQALGEATQDQIHALDNKAFESQMQDQRIEEVSEELMTDYLDEENWIHKNLEENALSKENQQEQSRPGALMVEKLDREGLASSKTANLEEQQDDVGNLEVNLIMTHFDSSATFAPCSLPEASRLWTFYENLTHSLSLNLTEQLRLILAPTLASKMRGDFRTGKRLNIKRIIPYIASNYRRDKIWMRRSVPSKRAYQILLAVDDSKSMSESQGNHLAFETLALVAKSLSMLEVGEICIVGFGETVRVAHPFDKPFSAEAGARTFQQFSFQQRTTNVKKLLQDSIALLRDARAKSSRSGATELWQLELIISDGVCEDHEGIRRLVRQAQEERIVIVFVIVDAGKGDSILDMNQAVFEPDTGSAGGKEEGSSVGPSRLRIKRYLDGFPFAYYLVVGDVKELPGVLATALRQWFAEVVESG